MVEEMEERRASFSGFRGMGGAGILAVDATGRETSKGESSKSVGGLGLGWGC